MPVAIPNYTLAVAGHAGHGKSDLVSALGAKFQAADDGDSSIRVAALRLDEYQLNIVDLPGRKELVGNIPAGAGSADLALLVVAADEGWKPQTEEHLQILSYLGIERGVIAVTKIDLAKDHASVLNKIKDQLRGTLLSEAAVVLVSTLSGDGIETLKTALIDELTQTVPQRDIGKPRLAVERAGPANGAGTAVAGTLVGGSFRRGQPVSIQPAGATAEIQKIKSNDRELETARPGDRVTIYLSAIQPPVESPSRRAGAIAAGDVICAPEMGRSSDVIDVALERLSRPAPKDHQPPPLKAGSQVLCHYGSGIVAAKIDFMEPSHLEPGTRIIARLLLQSPVMSLMHDRFVLRDVSRQHTLAGGIVLDPDPPRQLRGPRILSHRTLLKSRAESPPNPANFMSSQLARDGVGERATFLSRSRFSQFELDAAIERLIAAGAVVTTGDIIADFLWVDGLRQLTVQAIDAHHQQHPEKLGLPLTALRPVAAGCLPPNVEGLARPLMDALVSELCRDGFTRNGAVIRRASHRPDLPTRLQPAGQELRHQLEQTPFDPPSRKDLCQTDLCHEALKFLIATGEVMEISPDLVFSTSAYGRAVAVVRSHLESHGPATISELNAALSSSRRVAVPLLEKMDRDGITLRDGQKRSLAARDIPTVP